MRPFGLMNDFMALFTFGGIVMPLELTITFKGTGVVATGVYPNLMFYIEMSASPIVSYNRRHA